MKKIIFKLIAVFFIVNCNSGFSQTIIPDGSDVSGIWNVSGSPYMVQGTATIQNGDSLIINPGVVVKLDTGDVGGSLHVWGVLLANGNMNDSIYFTRNADSGYWQAIYIRTNSPNESSISYSKIEYGSEIAGIIGTLAITSPDLTLNAFISNNFISNNKHYGIAFGPTYYNTYSIIISENKISNNLSGGIYIRGQSPTIQNNQIKNNIGYGIRGDVSNTNATIIGNTIKNNTNWGISIDYYNSNPSILSNIIILNGGGIHTPSTNIKNNIIAFNNGDGIFSTRHNKIYNNTIVYNSGYGIFDENNGFEIINTIIFGNSQDFRINSGDDPKSISYSLISDFFLDNKIIDLGTNIRGFSPGFVDTNNLNFQLKYNSICINNGIPDTIGLGLPNIDPAGNNRIFSDIIDIGAYEFSGNFIRLESPNGKIGLKNNNYQPIIWVSNVTSMDIDYWSEAEQNWHTIVTNYINSLEYDWFVPASLFLDSCKLKISDHSNNDFFDISDYSFPIKDFTEIQDGSFLKGIWENDNSPYKVMGEATILIGDTLIIEPGVNIYLKTGIQHDYLSSDFDLGLIQINGIMKAEGTENDSIFFEGTESSEEWGMLLFRGYYSNNSHLSYCQIKNGSIIHNYSMQTMHGAISFYDSDALVEKSLIANNFDDGIHCYYASPILHCNEISNNYGNGIYGYGSHPQIVFNSIRYNTKNGISMVQFSMSPKIINNKINNNDKGIHGYNVCFATIYGNLIYENNFGIYMHDNSRPSLTNNTIVNNNTGIYTNAYDCDINVYNSIIWSNNTNFSLYSDMNIGYSMIEENNILGIAFDMGGNIYGLNPEFSDTLNNDYSLTPDSPCLDKGSFNTSILDSLDLAGNPRLSHGRVDMGAYECLQTGDWLHVVSPNWKEILESGANDTIKWIFSDTLSYVKIEYTLDEGNNWETIISSTENDGEYIWSNIPAINVCSAKIRITDIYDAAITDTSDASFYIATNLITDGEQISGIWSLANSPYTVERKAIIPQGQTLTIEPGVEVFFKTGTSYYYNQSYFNMGTLKVEGKLIAEGTQENPIHFTRLCDEGLWGMIFFENTADTTSILSNCFIDFASPVYFNDIYFGAVSFNNSGATIKNCEFSFNDYYAVDNSFGAKTQLINNKFYYNLLGGAILCWDSDEVKIINNAVYDNLWNGIYCYESSPAITNNTLSTTTAKGFMQSLHSVAQAIFIAKENDSVKLSPKAAFFNDEKSNAFYKDGKNLTYGLTCESNSNPIIYNSIFYGNGTNFNLSGSSPGIGYSLIGDESLPAGLIDLGNNLINENPEFIGEGETPLALLQNSPCVDAGNPDTTDLFLPSVDLAGNLRILNNYLIDMGAYEYPFDVQNYELAYGYQFISSRIIPENPDMLAICDEILDNLDFIRNTAGEMLRKIGPNWINSIGDWVTSEGYILRMNNPDELFIGGEVINPQTPIDLLFGYQLISYLSEQPINTADVFANVLENLDFVRNTAGSMFRKIGPNWVNSIGNMQAGEGYLVRMNAADVLIYPEVTKALLANNYVKPEHFKVLNANPYDPVWTIYFEKEALEQDDEIAVYDGEILVGVGVVVSDNIFENAIPVFSNLYETGNKPILKVWDKSENRESVLSDYTFSNPYGDAWIEDVFPAKDGEYSIVNITKDSDFANKKIIIFPNPGTENITIVSPSEIKKVSIFNYFGREFYKNDVSGKDVKINIRSFESGFYFIRIETANEMETHKIIIK
jgi:parallel beta-helix repeat protein